MARDLIKELEEEGSELNAKYINLCSFLDSKKAMQIEVQQLHLLQDQKKVMAEYLGILSNRVNLLKKG